jgi:hypothetical protein
MTSPDPTMAAVAAAVSRGHAGHREEARGRLTALWRQVGSDGDPLLRVTIAHFLADLQGDARDELSWDERALSAVAELTDERAQQHHAGLQVRAFLPSLHLNVADCRRRLDDPVRAREHLARAEQLVGELADDAYGQLLRDGLRHVRDALDAGSTAPLASAP